MGCFTLFRGPNNPLEYRNPDDDPPRWYLHHHGYGACESEVGDHLWDVHCASGDSMKVSFTISAPNRGSDTRSVTAHFGDTCTSTPASHPLTLKNLIKQSLGLLPSLDVGTPLEVVLTIPLSLDTVSIRRQQLNSFFLQEERTLDSLGNSRGGTFTSFPTDGGEARLLIWPDGSSTLLHAGECPKLVHTVDLEWRDWLRERLRAWVQAVLPAEGYAW